jgi:formate-dependent phosphoribosylglycinamide formyltransferase (GAR transformylase)
MDRKMPAILLVDPVRNGQGYKAAVRDLGFMVVSVYTLDFSTHDTGHDEGDDVSLYATDADEVARQVAELGLDIRAVVPALEAAVYLTDVIAERLELPGNDHGLALARRSKAAMRARAVEAGLTVPEFRLVHTVDEIIAACHEIGFPAIVKPTLGSCSQSVVVISDAESLKDLGELATHDLFGLPITEWLVEQYIRGREFAINSYSANGEHRVVDIWQYRQPDDGDYDFPVWETIQIDESDPDWKRVHAYALSVLDAYGIHRGPSHTEVKCGKDGVYLIEVGARLPGGPAVPMWSRHSAVIRPFHDAIECYLGGRPLMMDKPLEFQAKLGSLVLRNDEAPGTLVAVHGLEELSGLAGIDTLMVDCRPGDHIPLTRDSMNIPVSVFVTGPDTDTVLTTLATIRSLVTLEIQADPTPVTSGSPER